MMTQVCDCPCVYHCVLPVGHEPPCISAELSHAHQQLEVIRAFAQRQCDSNTDEVALWAQVVSMTELQP